MTAPLLVTSQFNQTVREYNGTTGVFAKVAASGGALGDPLGLVIGLDGNLLVSDGQTNQVKRYDGSTSAFVDVFASTNLAGPAGMTITRASSTWLTRIHLRASSASTPPRA
jgi:streptogramin lyase